MLQDIIDSKIDSAILGFYMAAPERAFSVIEISRRLSLPHQKAAHSLNKLVDVGPLKGFSKKGKRYFIVNTQYKLLPEIKKAFLKEVSVYKDELFAAIKNLGEIKAAFLSGIFTAQPALPVDLLLVGKVNLKKLSEFLKATAKMMGQEINYSIMSVREFELRRDTFDKFIKDIFDYPHSTVCDTVTKKKK
jgi:hypothetical protein